MASRKCDGLTLLIELVVSGENAVVYAQSAVVLKLLDQTLDFPLLLFSVGV